MITIQVPPSFQGPQQVYLRDLTQALNREFLDKVGRSTPVDQLLLASPSKKIYAVKVADDGTLSAELVQE